MRVLVADDHSLFRDGIVSLLEAAGIGIVGQVGSGTAAVEAALSLRPDLILMDISMPAMGGLEALRVIKKECPEIKVVMLTASQNEADLLEAAKSGACGYLLKSLNAGDFLDMLAGLQRGEAAMTRQTVARLMKGLAESCANAPAHACNLTQSELQLLRLAAQGKSNKAIAQTLCISQNTVKYHMKNILHKLDAQNRTEAVTRAMSAGILDSPPAA